MNSKSFSSSLAALFLGLGLATTSPVQASTDTWDVTCDKGFSLIGTLDSVRCERAVETSPAPEYQMAKCDWSSSEAYKDYASGVDYCFPKRGQANSINCPPNHPNHIIVDENQNGKPGVNDRCYKKCSKTGDYLSKVNKSTGAISDVDSGDKVDFGKYDLACRDGKDTKADVRKPELKKN